MAEHQRFVLPSSCDSTRLHAQAMVEEVRQQRDQSREEVPRPPLDATLD